jgi:hypothetical protein
MELRLIISVLFQQQYNYLQKIAHKTGARVYFYFFEYSDSFAKYDLITILGQI